MKKTFFIIVLLYFQVSFSQDTLSVADEIEYLNNQVGVLKKQNAEINLRLQAGEHLQTAAKHFYTGIGFAGTTIILSGISASVMKENKPMWLILTGVSGVIGFSFNISAWNQINKAGNKMLSPMRF